VGFPGAKHLFYPDFLAGFATELDGDWRELNQGLPGESFNTLNTKPRLS